MVVRTASNGGGDEDEADSDSPSESDEEATESVSNCDVAGFESLTDEVIEAEAATTAPARVVIISVFFLFMFGALELDDGMNVSS